AGLQDVESRYRKRYVDLWANPEAMRVFQLRSKIVAGIRRLMDARGFIEVETPMLQAQAGGAAARPFVTHMNALDIDLSMRIAPELYLKRLLVGGMRKVYEINRNFRNEGVDKHHNPEFTMLEWYRPGLDHHALMDEVDELLAAVSGGGVEKPRRLRFPEVFEDVVGAPPGDCEDGRLAEVAARHGVVGAMTLDRAELLDALLATVVQPVLGDAPVHLLDFPPELAALALVRDGVAQRFELHLGGREVANGYHELLDADECRRRMTAENARRRRHHRPEHVPDERLLAALAAGLPASAGVALGVDRLLAFLEGAGALDGVIAFPADIA
ncbi:MAG: lysine--tRNA ligase, partial [Planctomycetes bacterium]|nr:lysine--tRNA ligase [Planctomycetota bacterium]